MDFAALTAVLTGLILTVFAMLQELEKRRRKKKEPTLQDRISDLTKNLDSSGAVIAEIEGEILKRKNLVTQLEEDIERYKRLKEISQPQVEAIAQTLEIPLKKESRKAFWENLIMNILIAGAFFAIGYVVGGG